MAGCAVDTPPDGKFVVVFVDVSASVKATSPDDAAWELITRSLRPGDNIVLGVISDSTLTTFQPSCNTEIPYYPWYEKADLIRKKELKRLFAEKITGAMKKAHEAPRSRNTEIMSALVVAGKVFGMDKRRRVLVILSDMLEDSPGHDFEEDELAPAATQHLIDARRKQGFIPDLQGAKVYVAGASAKSAKKTLEVQRFWFSYLAACNAQVTDARYGPALLRFDE